jgi:hypothetical protein
LDSWLIGYSNFVVILHRGGIRPSNDGEPLVFRSAFCGREARPRVGGAQNPGEFGCPERPRRWLG